MTPYPNTMAIWPNFRSPLVWDVFAVSTYLLVSFMFWFVGLIPDLASMREEIAVMDTARKDPDAFIEADLDFHLALAEAAANPLILSLIDSIVGLLREQRMGIFQVEGGPERGQYHHKKILEAVEHRDPLGARDAMKAHLRQVREDSRRAPGGQES